MKVKTKQRLFRCRLILLIYCFNQIICSETFEDLQCMSFDSDAESFMKLEGYQNWKNGMRGKPTDVYNHVLFTYIGGIDKVAMTFEIQLWHKFRWYDPRLPLVTEPKALEEAYFDKLWIPIQCYNIGKHVEIVTTLKDNSGLMLLQNRTMYQYSLYNIVLSCPMNFVLYPFDEQECTMEISALKHHVNEVIQHWAPNFDVILLEHLRNTPEYDISINLIDTYSNVYQSGLCSHIGIQFRLKRNIGGHLVSTFLPSLLFTLLSWFTLILPPHLIQPRVTLAVTTLLTTATILANVRNDLPPMKKWRAIDLWFIMCIIFNFGVLLETVVVVQYCMKHKIDRIDNFVNLDKVDVTIECLRVRRIESICKKLCLTAIIVFNICFWTTYMGISGRL